MGRSPMNTETEGLKKGAWTPEEDRKLIEYIEKYGQGKWQVLPKRAGLNRCGKSCRLRWANYLRPDIKRGNFSPQEQHTIIHLHSSLGNKWSMIATHLPGRTDNEIKNYWNTHLRKKLLLSGIDPKTHQPVVDLMKPLQDLAKIQLLANILQLLNSNPLPSFLGGSEFILDGPNMENASNYEPVLDSFPDRNNGRLPGFVPTSPEICSGSHVHCVNQSVPILSHDQFNNCDSWGTAEDDGSLWKHVFDDFSLTSSSL